MINDVMQKSAAKAFSEHWAGKGYEKGESQAFWLSLLRDVYGVKQPEKFIVFEEQVHLDHTSFIDGMIPSTKVMIEQKGLGKDLNKPIKQSDGSLLTPFQQAKRYIVELPYEEHPRWVVTCNFSEFWVYDMNKPSGEPEVIRLENLEKEYYRLQFLVDSENEHLKRETEVSIAAGEIVGLLYDAFLSRYAGPSSPRALKSLNVLCVRIVFCLYAEDAGIFGRHGLFHDYLSEFDAKGMRKALIELFKVLDTPPEERVPYLSDDNPRLAAFPYVNGGLFSDENIEIPPLTDEIRSLILSKASDDFDWSEISPTIFGAVFESTLNPETRRTGGMHYTSIENIHKVIDPLFLDDLKREFKEICAVSVLKTKEKKLREFQKKLSGLTFLDPACGSGNFLTETYLSLRRLENEVMRELYRGQITFGDENYNPIQVTIDKFYGIEINDFAVTVAKTALWIAESQMIKETESIVLMQLDFLPLKTNAGIVEGNALRIDWEDVVPKHSLSYIMGNPPFVGNNNLSAEQRVDVSNYFPKNKTIDYVACWYICAAKFIEDTEAKCAFVSTNSITQGEQVPILWKDMMMEYGIVINFAYRTFRWGSEAKSKAHVHCVIIGFSRRETNTKYLYTSGTMQIVNNINAYLSDAPNVFIESRKRPICDVPQIRKGNQPTDGGNLIIEADEIDDFLRKEPKAKAYIKKLIGAREYINNLDRYCLWLVDVNPTELRKMPLVMDRIAKVREMRLASPDKAVWRLADTPTVFRETNNPETFIIVPSTSSENRRYIPMGFLDKNTIPTNAVLIIPNATLYHFGVLTSNVHMAWMRAVCGRLKSDYRYSKDIVYNNFPWPAPDESRTARIEQTAKEILNARNFYPDSSLADLYDELTMPPELRRAHQQNDRAVMQAYGFSVKDMTESSCVAELMRMYNDLTNS